MLVPDLQPWPGCTYCPLHTAGHFVVADVILSAAQEIVWQIPSLPFPRQDTNGRNPGLRKGTRRPIQNQKNVIL
jgi:hypothetical protein